jgi:D-Tyr-tRNAtyr deacylase
MKEYTDKELAQRLEQGSRSLNGIYYWVFVNHSGKNVCIGYKNSESEAEQYAYSKSTGEYKIIPMKTRDINSAIRQAKGNILNSSNGNLDKATQRFKREVNTHERC